MTTDKASDAGDASQPFQNGRNREPRKQQQHTLDLKAKLQRNWLRKKEIGKKEKKSEKKKREKKSGFVTGSPHRLRRCCHTLAPKPLLSGRRMNAARDTVDEVDDEMKRMQKVKFKVGSHSDASSADLGCFR